MGELKGVCIGAGYFSKYHFEAWKRIGEVHIVGVYDENYDRAQQAVKTYDLGLAYDSIEMMFIREQPDFVDIITPPDTHKNLCEVAARFGTDIICQKPLAPTLQEAEDISEMVRNSAIRMMVHENFRFQPWHREIKKIMQEGTLGNRLHAINFRTRMGDGWQKDAYLDRQPYFRTMERLLVYETGIHFIDTFRYLGGEITGVYAKLGKLNPEIAGEDFGWIQFEFENGALGLWDANRYNESRYENPRYTFGNMVLEMDGGSLWLNENGEIIKKPLGNREAAHIYNPSTEGFAGDCVHTTQTHFIQRIFSGEAFETDIFDYLKNLILQEKIYESNATNTFQCV